MEDKAYHVSADVRTRWGVFSVRSRDLGHEHRWARQDKVDSLWECGAEELRENVADVQREAGISVLYGLRWEEVWEIVSQTQDSLSGGRVCVRVCVDKGVGSDRVARSK